MATPGRELSYGAIQIFDKEILGVGSYGKVCKAKYGQLPCAVKLLHDSMFQDNDPGIGQFVKKFDQECEFLSKIKHPNIVQFLGISRDPQTGRLALLMELMNESLTIFLNRSTGPISYHTQLNISYDIALALAYLHSNSIIHRDLSSNNVLLIGEGTRAKVTDFGMSVLIGMNPRMTQLTQCPGTVAYMPPEALITPPRYSSKLDCFSHGVLAIQIATRQFPNPGDAHRYIDNPAYPTGQILVPFPETERRKNHIDLVEHSHPLLPLALHCLKNRDTERPSADELCGRLASLKRETKYTRSVQHSRKLNTSFQEQLYDLQQQIHEKACELAKAYEQLDICRVDLQITQEQVLEKDIELASVRANHNAELRTLQYQIQERNDVRASEYHAELQSEYEDELRKMEFKMKQSLVDHRLALEAKTAECERRLVPKEEEINRLHRENRQLLQNPRQPVTTDTRSFFNRIWKRNPGPVSTVSTVSAHPRPASTVPTAVSTHQKPASTMPAVSTHRKPVSTVSTHQLRLTWKQGKSAPETMTSFNGSAIVHNNRAYFSQERNVYLYSIPENKWTTLQPCGYGSFTLAVVDERLTTVGGGRGITATNNLLSLVESSTNTSWEKLLPPMPTERVRPAAVTTPTHLVVAGGRTSLWRSDGLSTVEVLDFCHQQWASVSSLPKALELPSMTQCDGQLYLSDSDGAIFSCSVNELVNSCSSLSVWIKVSNIPGCESSLATLRGHVLAIGGCYGSGTRIGAIHSYIASTNLWKAIGEVPTPRSNVLVAVLPSDKLVLVGGWNQPLSACGVTEIALA